MTDSKDLTTTAPSNQAIIRRFRDVVAKSPKDIKPGQIVLVDRHGVAFGRPRYARLVVGLRVGIYGALMGGWLLAMSGAWLPGALLYMTGLMPTLVIRYRGGGKLLAMNVLVRQGQLDEAKRRFDAVPELRRRNPAAYCSLAGDFASHRGDYASALTWWREALPHCKGLARAMMQSRITKALLLSGRIKEARYEHEATTFPPAADEVLTGQSLTRLMFVLCDPSADKPSDDDLHEWASRALEYSHTGVELATIGWAFDRAGDADMARFLATEAMERMHHPYLATWWPALQQWLDAHASKPDATEPVS